MIDFFSSIDSTTFQWTVIIFSAVLTGIARTGIFGVMLLVVPLLSLQMPGRTAAGLVLPLMVAGDFIAAYVYRKTFSKKAMLQILPWLILGLGLGALIGGAVSNRLFKMIMASTTFTCMAFAIWNELRHGKPLQLNSQTIAVIGILSGFASMIGNAAGPVIAVYFIALNLKKMEYVSSIVWLFWIVNLLKLPFHIFLWKTVNLDVLKLDLILAPALCAGMAAGIWIVRKIPEKPFRMVILASIFAAGTMLLLK